MVDFEKNTPLVYYVFDKYYKRMIRYKEDMIQCGMLGLWKACKSFDERLGCRFSAYASACIRNEMTTFVRKELKYSKNTVDSVVMNENGVEKNLIDFVEDEKIRKNVDLMLLLNKMEVFKEYIQGKTFGEISKEMNEPRRKICDKFIKEKKIIENRLKE